MIKIYRISNRHKSVGYTAVIRCKSSKISLNLACNSRVTGKVMSKTNRVTIPVAIGKLKS